MSAAAPGLAPARGALAVRLFGCFALGYFMSYGLRSINAMLAPELTAELGLGHAQLGSLSSAYFLAFALMQVPVGVWLDRFGPRRVDAVLMGVAAMGCAGFALSHSFSGLWIARALVGVGVSAGLMAAMTGYRQWFAPAHQTRLAAWTLVAGTAGVLTTTVPVHAVLPAIGWRGVFWVAAAMLGAIAVAMWTLLPRDREPPADAGAGPSFAASLAGYGEVFRSAFFWRMSLVAGVLQGGFAAMQSLWVGPWLERVLATDAAVRADRLFAFNLVLMVAFLALGAIAPRIGAQRAALVRIVSVVAAVVVGLELAIAGADGPWAWLLWPAYAACATVYTLVQPRIGLAFPSRLAGRALTGSNLLIFSCMFASQWGFGIAIDAFRGAGLAEADAFRAAMAGFGALHAACLALFVLWPRRWGGH